MSLKDLQQSLIQEAKTEERKIIKEAENESAKILADAKEEAKKIKAISKKKAAAIVQAEKKERSSAAKLKAKKLFSEAKNDIANTALKQIWNEFKKTPEKKEYQAMLKKHISKAEKELGAKCIVTVNSKDLKLAKKISKNVASKTEEISGGAIISTKDRKISIDNSLETIFENKKDEVNRIVYTELFK